MLSNGKVDCLTKKKQLAQLTFSILTFTYCNPSHLDAQYLHQLLMGNRSFILIKWFSVADSYLQILERLRTEMGAVQWCTNTITTPA